MSFADPNTVSLSLPLSLSHTHTHTHTFHFGSVMTLWGKPK